MTDINLHLWVIPLLPLAGAAINGIFGRHFKNAIVSLIALFFTAASLGYAVWAVVQGLHMEKLPYIETVGTWIWAGKFSAPFGFYFDQLSMVMVLVVTGVGFLIHIYSVSYMAHEGGFYRFFSYMNLFMFFMLTLVLANNYLLMFVGWEGVGLASYLLIGFFFLKDSAADAGKKAFIVNRIGDFGFLIGMFLLIQQFGTLNYDGVFKAVSGLQPETGWGLLTGIALCLMFGATGKSAQVPLYVWLPDAMEGPTPVSALIHAATMVTAGIYMIARSNAIFSRAPHALEVVAIIGCITAFFAATMGMAQTDIKRVLAYSTVSQLGYMFLACGVAAYSAAIFHLMTHAFFKALLFLGAGSVIHAIGGEQDMRRMGGLHKLVPRTHFVMLVATLAIAGIPPFAGFFSKDEILGQVFSSPHGSKILWVVGVITAALTSFYMFRLYFMTFYGDLKLGQVDVGEEAHAATAPAQTQHPAAAHSHGHADDQSHGHGRVHESPWIMIGPLMVLALLSFVGGWIGVPAFMGGRNNFANFLAPVIKSGAPVSPAAMEHVSEAAGNPSEEQQEKPGEEWGLASTSVAAALIGLFFAWLLYYKHPRLPDMITAKIHGIYLTVLHKYYVDEGYGLLFIKPLLGLSTVVFWRGVDQGLIDGLVNGAGTASKGIGNELRRMQSGNIRSYAAWIAAGGAAVIAYMIWLGVSK
ncbi:MAG: NADH-quinone oxidoreductase subunit L [Candidatus Angelobacter sp.]